MKSALTLLISLFMAIAARAADTNAPAVPANSVQLQKIGVADATNHYDQTMIVTGKVAQVSVRPSVVIINLEKAFPNAPFSAVVFSRATNKFGNLPALKDKDVEIKGLIKLYHDKPEIILNDPGQLIVLTNSAVGAESGKK